MAKYASTLLNIARGWLGCNEKDGSFKKIIDLYNNHKPLARGYKVKYTDHWCATFVSACAIKANMTDLIPTECGCGQMIELFKQKGIWKEADNYIPSPGDIIMYDWDDSGIGDNTSWPDHVGIVESCDGTNIVVIEGNKNEVVARRTIKVNAKFIRGYGVPKFGKETVLPGVNLTVTNVTAKECAKKYTSELSGSYKVTASALHLRDGVGTEKKSLVVLPKGTVVKNYGYYTVNGNVIWLYIQVTLNGIKYTGFSSSRYLVKI